MFRNIATFLLVLIGVLGLSACAQGRIIAKQGDVTIKLTGDKFTCDKIECPADADYCVVTKKKDPKDDTVLLRTDTCYSKTKKVLKEEITEESIDANLKVNAKVTGYRSGWTTMTNSHLYSYSSSGNDGEHANANMPNWWSQFAGIHNDYAIPYYGMHNGYARPYYGRPYYANSYYHG